MRVALCTAYLEGDLWETRLCEAMPELAVDEFSPAEALATVSKIAEYDAVVVALSGIDGLRLIYDLRCAVYDIPILWIADERVLATAAYTCHVTHFLLSTADRVAVRDALEHCLAVRRSQ